MKRLETIRDRNDPSLSYTRLVDVRTDVTKSRERPWQGQLIEVEHDQGPVAAGMKSNAVFDLMHSTMLTVPGVQYPTGLADFSEQHLRSMIPVRLLGTFLCRSDTLEVIGYSSLRRTIIEPSKCFERFWKLADEANFIVEAAGLTYNGTVLAIFARHKSDPFCLGANKFIRYMYFLSAFGGGFTPALVHAAYHPISGKTFLVDVQELGKRRVRGLQVSKKCVAGTDKTLEAFRTKGWDEDWHKMCQILTRMSEFAVTPLQAARILTMSITSYAKPHILTSLASDVAGNFKRFPSYKKRVESAMRRWRESHILATPECIHSILGVVLAGIHGMFTTRTEFPTSASWAVEMSSSGITRKRAVFREARTLLGEVK